VLQLVNHAYTLKKLKDNKLFLLFTDNKFEANPKTITSKGELPSRNNVSNEYTGRSLEGFRLNTRLQIKFLGGLLGVELQQQLVNNKYSLFYKVLTYRV
jgi:hypothetical protein